MNIKKNSKRTLSLFVIMSMLLPTISSIGVFAATKKTTLVSVKTASATSVTLKWKKISTINGYEIYQKKAGEKFKKVKTINNKKTKSCKISNLTAATKYTYKIRTYKTVKKKKNYSSFSTAKSVTTNPSTPILISAESKKGEVNIQWKKVNGAKGYVIYIKTDKGNIKLATSTSTSAKVKAEVGDILTIRAYLTVSKKNIYSEYAKGIEVVSAYATEQDLKENLDELRNLLESSYVTDEKAQQYIEDLKKLLTDSYATKEQLEGYFKEIKDTLTNDYVTKEEAEKALDEVKASIEKCVTEEYLQQSLDELRNLLESTYVTDEKVQEYLDDFKSLFADSYVTKDQLVEYFNSIKDTITEGYVTEEEMQQYLEELKEATGNKGYVDITDSINIEKCYYAHWNGEKIPFNNAQGCYLSVSPGDKFRVSAYSVFDVALAIFYDKNGNIINNTSYVNPDGKKYNNELIVIPEGCYYVAFASHITGLPNNIMLNVKKHQVSDKVNPNAINSRLYGKKMYANGDSIAEGAEKYSYVDSITNEFVMSTNNEAKSGTTLAVREGYDNSICERILAMDTTEEYDYILIEGGFNDLLLNVEIGEMTNPHDFGGYYDRTTVIGAMETICHHLVNNYYESKKLFVLGHNCFGFWDSQIEYWNAIKGVLEKWGIPYIDLRKETNLCKRTENDPIADKYFVNGDGIHPTKDAYEIFYVPLIRARLEDL